MILNLVDQRSFAGGPEGTGRGGAWVRDNFGLLTLLAAQVGPADWAVDLVLVDDARMAGLNEGFRGADGVTDVLSFSYLAAADEGRADLAAGVGHAAHDLQLDAGEAEAAALSGAPPVVGEVILAPDFVGARCEANGWPIGLEFPLLVVHGLLHILGWDHQEEEERQAMQDIEEAVLAGHELAHPLRRRS